MSKKKLLIPLLLILTSCAAKHSVLVRGGGATLSSVGGLTVSAYKISVIPDVWEVVLSNTSKYERCARLGFNSNGAKWVSSYDKPLRLKPGKVISLGSYIQEIDYFMGFGYPSKYQFRLNYFNVSECTLIGDQK